MFTSSGPGLGATPRNVELVTAEKVGIETTTVKEKKLTDYLTQGV